MKELLDSFAEVSERLLIQQKVVRKIETIIRAQNRDLITEEQHLHRLRILFETRKTLALIKEELYSIVDTLTLPE